MKQRILVRTVNNVSYVGSESDSPVFKESGIKLNPNENLKMIIFIPEEEILEIISECNIYSYKQYSKINRRRII